MSLLRNYDLTFQMRCFDAFSLKFSIKLSLELNKKSREKKSIPVALARCHFFLRFTCSWRMRKKRNQTSRSSQEHFRLRNPGTTSFFFFYHATKKNTKKGVPCVEKSARGARSIHETDPPCLQCPLSTIFPRFLLFFDLFASSFVARVSFYCGKKSFSKHIPGLPL